MKLIPVSKADIFWHTRQAIQIERELNTNILTGLSQAAASERLEEIGPKKQAPLPKTG